MSALAIPADAEAFVAWCESHLGFTEGPRNNQQPFARLAGHAELLAWCASFVVAADLATGSALPREAHSAYTPTMFTACKRAGMIVAEPQRGDLGFVWYRELQRIGHVFVVRRALPPRAVATVEGNTNQEASRTGGQVASLVRDHLGRSPSAWVHGFVRPRWDGVVPGPRMSASVVPGALVRGRVDARSPSRLPLLARGAGGASAPGSGWVHLLQECLTAAGTYRGRLDADFGRGTEAALRALQGRHGLRMDGVCHHWSWMAAMATAGTLRPGAAGGTPGLEVWQNVLGYRGTELDRVRGADTDARTRQVQRALGVEPDGVVGEATRAAYART